MNKKLFGAWITYTHKIYKQRKTLERGAKSETTHPVFPFPSRPVKALLIGERFLPNGTTRHYGLLDEFSGDNYTEGEFTVTGTTHCLLVVTNPRVNPIRVAIEGAMLLDGTPIKDVM